MKKRQTVSRATSLSVLTISAVLVLSSCRPVNMASDKAAPEATSGVQQTSMAQVCDTHQTITRFINSKFWMLDQDGVPTRNLAKRFCLHTVRDGTSNLVTGNPIRSQVEDGLVIAIADMMADADEAISFRDTKVICDTLTEDKFQGRRWRTIRSSHPAAQPVETNPGRSIEALAAYFAGTSRAEESFWSGSHNSMITNIRWYFDAKLGFVQPVMKDFRLNVRCIAN